MVALMLGLAAFVLQGAALCGEAHAAPPAQDVAHCVEMAAAAGGHHADAAPAPLRHACANACHPPAVAPALPQIAPATPLPVAHGQDSLASLSGIAPPPATPPPRRG